MIKTKHQHLLSFFLALTCITAAYFISSTLPGQKWAITMDDAYFQCTAFSRMLMRHLLDGSGMFYSHELSLGQNTSMVYALYAYTPFSLLYLLPIDSYTILIIGNILRVAFSAAFFELFLRKGLHISGSNTVFFSLCYSLSSFHVYLLRGGGPGLEGIWILPLIMWMLFDFIHTNRPVGLCLAYLLSFVSSFYGGYINGLASFCALMIYLYLRDGRLFLKKNLRLLLHYLLLTITALLLSMFLLFPAFSFYFNSMSGSYNGSFLSSDNFITLLSKFYWASSSPIMANSCSLYAGVPLLLLLPLYFIDKSFKQRERIIMFICFMLLFLSYYITPIYLALHAFNPPTGYPIRYAYPFILLACLLAAKEYSSLRAKKVSLKPLLLYLGIHVGICVLILSFSNLQIPYILLINIIILVIWTLLYYFSQSHHKSAITRYIATIILMIELCTSTLWNIPQTYSSRDYSYEQNQLQPVIEYIKEQQSDGQLYRARISNTALDNLQSEQGYNGVGLFATSVYPALNTFMLHMGDNTNGYGYAMQGITDFTDMLLGIRYRFRLDEYEKPYNNDLYYGELYENALSIGFASSADLIKLPKMSTDPFVNQNNILSSLMGQDCAAYIPAPVPVLQSIGMNITLLSDGCIQMQRNPGYDLGWTEFTIPNSGYSHAYFLLSSLVEDKTLTERRLQEDELMLSLFSERDRLTNGAREDNIAALGKGIIEMDITESGQFSMLLLDQQALDTVTTFPNLYIYYQDDAILKTCSDSLSVNSWKILDSDSLNIHASVTVTEERPLLFMSIPYDPAWECIADGETIDILPVIDNTFCAVPLSPGTHDIHLHYNIPGLTEGIICLIMGCILFCILCFFFSKDKIKYHSSNHVKITES